MAGRTETAVGTRRRAAAMRLLRVKKPTIARGQRIRLRRWRSLRDPLRHPHLLGKRRNSGSSARAYGLVVGASQLPRIVGAPVAKELIFTARIVDAEEARSIGLANHVVPHTELASVVAEMASAIAANSPTAVMASKEVIDLGTTIPEGGKREMEHNLELRQGEDHRKRFRSAAERVTGQG